MIQEIIGANHAAVKKITSLKEKKYRERYGEFLVEGAMSVLWALNSSYAVSSVVVSTDFSLPEALQAALDDRRVYCVAPHVFAKMADTKTPQGILCSCILPAERSLPEHGRFIYCDRVRDPGNVGSIIRTADAMGFDGVMLSAESVDPYNPKLVRSTMGSLFHIDIYTAVDGEALRILQERGFTLTVSALQDNSIASSSWQAAPDAVLALGNEAQGVSQEILALADEVVKIPMTGSAESLNVAAAAAILMYEAAQRK